MMDYSKCTPACSPMPIKQEFIPPLVLDLSVRKRQESPDYTLTYPSPKQSPVYTECTETHTPLPLYYPRPKSISEGSETSESSNLSDVTSPTSRLKSTRPFKAFPKNPLSLTLDIVTKSDPLLGADSTTAYEEFRQRMLAQVRLNHSGTNKNMRRTQNQNEKIADPTYLEKRKKNNEAAKRSRDARKAKEDEIAIRCAFLEQEHMKLKYRIAVLESEVDRLQRMVYP